MILSFEFADQMTRVYYRYIDEFYRIFADKITRVVLEKVNRKRPSLNEIRLSKN